MSFLSITKTGVQGMVVGDKKNPMINATLKLRGMNKSYEVTKIHGLFKIMLPPGKYYMEVLCHNYKPRLLTFEVVADNLITLNVELEKDAADKEIKEEVTETNGLVYVNIKGYIRDGLNHPINKANILIKERNVTIISDNAGQYNTELIPGNYTFIATASGFMQTVKYVDVTGINSIPNYVMITLPKDETVMGLPRMAFIVLAGKHFIASVDAMQMPSS